MALSNPSLLLYARAKWGKSVAALRALGPNAYWLACERGALNVAADPELNPWRRNGALSSAGGDGKPIVPDFRECLDVDKPYEEVANFLRSELVPALRAGKYAAVVQDTLSSWCNRELARIHKDGVKDNYGAANRLLLERLLWIINTILGTGAIYVALAHEKEPSIIEGKFTPGGPDLPGPARTAVPAQFDVVVRGIVDGSGDSARRVLRCSPLDGSFVTGDRWNVVKNGEAADLREVLKRCVTKMASVG